MQFPATGLAAVSPSYFLLSVPGPWESTLPGRSLKTEEELQKTEGGWEARVAPHDAPLVVGAHCVAPAGPPADIRPAA